MRKKLKYKALSAVLAISMLCTIIMPTVYAEELNSDIETANAEIISDIPEDFLNAYETSDEKIIYNGSASVEFTEWSDWNYALDLRKDSFNVNDFAKPFMLVVDYQSEEPPVAVFMSWSGGKDWAEVKASYASKGKAYYLYESITEAYGSDFSQLNAVRIYPYNYNLTVTKVSLVYESQQDIEVTYSNPAGDLVSKIKIGWNLGNSLDAYGDWVKQYTDNTPADYETSWHNPVTTKKMIDDVKLAGFNAVRVPVTWNDHMDEKGNVDPVWMNRVQEVVNYVIDNNMYCIINVHHDTGEDHWLRATSQCVAEKSERFQHLWTQIAQRFKSYDNRLIFEGFNEMLDANNNWNYSGKEATSAVNSFNQIFVDTVRATEGNNSKRCLIVNTYAANTHANNLDEFVIPNDTAQNSLIVEVHYYQPYKYCSDSYPDVRTWKENGGKSNIDGTFYSLYAHFTSKGIPVIIGEFAAPNKDNDNDRCDYVNYLLSTAKKYGIKCFWWDKGGTLEDDPTLGYYDSMGLYDRYNNTWKFPAVIKALTGCDVEADNAKSIVTINKTSLDFTIKRNKLNPYATLSAKVVGVSGTKTWYSTNISVATVTDKGKVTAVGEGVAKIYCRAADGSTGQPCVVTVHSFRIDSDNMRNNVVYINVGDTCKTTLNTDASHGDITWKSSSASTASIDSQGKVTALKKGSVTITASAPDKSKDTVKLVAVMPSEGVTLKSYNASVYTGKTVTLKAILTTKGSNDPVFWSTSDASIATVSDKGVVKGIKQGTVKITATTFNGKSAVADVIVRTKATALEFTKVTPALYMEGNTGSFSVTVKSPVDSNDTIKWATSNKKAIEIINTSADGRTITIKSGVKGSATITAKAGSGKSISYKVTSVNAPAESVVLNMYSANVYVGKTITLKAKQILPKTCNDVVIWRSTDTNIATVDQNGKVTGISQGDVTIVADSFGGVKNSVNVTVRSKASAISVDKTECTINVGSNVTINVASIAPQGCNDNITWVSSSKSYAVVTPSSDGKSAVITGIKNGSATITVKTGSGKYQKIKVKVTA